MLTIDEMLEQVRRGWTDSGSCFGVSGPSRLRPAFKSHRRRAEPPICDGCKGKKKHRCKKKVQTIYVDTTGERMKVKRSFVKCACQKCNKKK